MISFKKYLPLVIAFVLGGLIVYLAMCLKIAEDQLKERIQPVSSTPQVKEEVKPAEEEKYWLDERIEKQAVETEERTKKQQSEGDELKSQFDQFAE